MALAVVALRVAYVGTAPTADEGPAAHLFQLLILGQLPLVAYFAFRNIRRGPDSALVVLGLQACALIAALAPVKYLGW